MEAAPANEGVRRDLAVTDKVRGLLLGLGLGNALAGSDALPDAGPIFCGVGTQLAATNAECVIRARVRWASKGIVSTSGVLWRGLQRWASVQGLQLPKPIETTGWVCRVPMMAERRGSAPATTNALTAGRMGSIEEPVGMSAGAHALVRALPWATTVVGGVDTERAAKFARESAALTHGHPGAWASAGAGVMFAAAALKAALDGTAAGIEDCESAMSSWILFHHPDDADPALEAHLYVKDNPGSLRGLEKVCQGRDAAAVLGGAVYCVLSYPEASQVLSAIALAAKAPDARSTAAVTGALLGVVHGASALPVELVSRLDAGWMLDVLARDLVTEMLHSPAGGEYQDAADPTWRHRYPGN